MDHSSQTDHDLHAGDAMSGRIALGMPGQTTLGIRRRAAGTGTGGERHGLVVGGVVNGCAGDPALLGRLCDR
jgi:hypothetical protein